MVYGTATVAAAQFGAENTREQLRSDEWHVSGEWGMSMSMTQVGGSDGRRQVGQVGQVGRVWRV